MPQQVSELHLVTWKWRPQKRVMDYGVRPPEWKGNDRMIENGSSSPWWKLVILQPGSCLASPTQEFRGSRPNILLGRNTKLDSTKEAVMALNDNHLFRVAEEPSGWKLFMVRPHWATWMILPQSSLWFSTDGSLHSPICF